MLIRWSLQEFHSHSILNIEILTSIIHFTRQWHVIGEPDIFKCSVLQGALDVDIAENLLFGKQAWESVDFAFLREFGGVSQVKR